MRVRRPTVLSAGSLIRVVSPALPTLAFASERAARAKSALERLGLRVDYSPRARFITDDGWSAGSGKERAADINEAFADPDVDAVFSAVGGATTKEVVEHLDIEVLRASDKAFIGRSDNVFLNAVLLRHAGLSSFYGATFLPQFGEPPAPMPETVEAWCVALMARAPTTLRTADDHTLYGIDWRGGPGLDHAPQDRHRPGKATWLRSGRATGRLAGGELSVVVDLLEQDLLDLDGAILFWDVVDDQDDRVPRLWANLNRLADLSVLRGMIVGDNTFADATEWERQVAELVDSTLPGHDIPIGVGFDCGHYDPTWILPYGDQVTLDSRDGLTIYPN